MAPLTIAIHKDPDGVDPISPLPVRVNDFQKSNVPSPTSTRSPGSRILSGKSASRQGKELEDLENKYKETKLEMEEIKRQKSENLNFANVQRKIEAIMYEMDEAKKRYDELKNEKSFPGDSILGQDQQIKEMEDQIKLLNERLQKEENEQKARQSKVVEEQMANTEELEQQVMLQEMEIMNLTAEIEQLRQKKGANSIGDQIKQQEASNAAKYAEIQKMEEKLKSMRDEQDDFKIQQASIVEKHTEEQSEFVVKPTSATYDEISRLQDDITNLRMQQEKLRATSTSKSQPWNQDLKKQEGICTKKTELEVVANNDIRDFEEPVDSQSDNEEHNILSLPRLEEPSKSVTSTRKEKNSAFGSSDRSVSSAQSLESIDEENESEPVEIKKTKTIDSNSDTSATGISSSSSSRDDASSTKDSTPSVKENAVEIMHTDDGSIEAINYTRPALKSAPSQASDEGTFSSASNNSSSSESSQSEGSRASSRGSSSGFYSSDASTQSSSRSILEQIPEEAETDDSDAESEGPKSVKDQETKELQTGSLILRKQLKESESKFESLMSDYKQLVSKSQLRMEKLQEENRKLRDSQGAALKSMAQDSEEEKKSRWLKQENKMLLKSMEKQNEVLDKANKNYEKLQNEHSATLAMLEDKNKRYDRLILDFSNLAGTGKNSEDYNRLRALHETVVLKLADMGEDNDRLEKERDVAIEELENKDVQIRAHDEAIASLNKTEYDLKMLENVHEETIIELQQLTDKNKELKAMNENGVSNEDFEQLKQDHVATKTELELLAASNKEFSGIQDKLNASEVKVAMLEEEDKKMKEKLHATKKKSKSRADQLKDVISQYKALKTEYSEKCVEVDRLKIAAEGLDGGKGMKEMDKLVEAVQTAKKDAEEAAKSKTAREKDLRIVLNHYEKLRLKYEKVRAKLDSKDSTPFDEGSCASRSQPFDEASTTEEGQKKSSVASDDESSKYQEEVENLEKLLKESKDSVVWKDDKIVQTLTELKSAKGQIKKLEKEKKSLESELSDVKSKLLLAQKETENAEEKKGSGQERLRGAIAKHHQLQQVYDSLLKKFNDSRAELERAKNEIKVKKQEEKHARKRAATVHTQYKKLKEDHDVVVQRLEKLKEEMTTNNTAEC
eukprot:CAMPEP_0116142886 /NCGR_PEP_ID=MMETSP0329-20121206/15149_1 /TAXON_ID=697910 /ORGANISM="Pseudo-nitzschia arenysensis, Strain B593" /LENGTH=1130 /DNA_ID=CAMNT_0003638155 /DNA_START=73 /DNA_END=3465 /DNA_ORIENTATION=+